MELLDLVNENDEIIGVTTKEKSHANREIHRIVAIYVFDKDGKLYLQEHLKSGGKYDHSVGGHVKHGESYAEAAKREAFEELGITDRIKVIAKFYPKDVVFGKNGMHAIGLYEVHPAESWVFTPNDEVQNIYPYTLDAVVAMINDNPEEFTTDFIRTIRRYIRIKQLPLQINH